MSAAAHLRVEAAYQQQPLVALERRWACRYCLLQQVHAHQQRTHMVAAAALTCAHAKWQAAADIAMTVRCCLDWLVHVMQAMLLCMLLGLGCCCCCNLLLQL
jgi:hypothetical protein